MKAMGQFAEGIAAYDAGKFTKKVMQLNATHTERDGAAETSRLRDAARLSMGRQVAGLASSGFSESSGSAIDALRESAIESEMDIMNTRRRASLQAAGLRTQGALARNEGYSRMVGGIVSGAATMVEEAAKYGGGG